MKAKSKPLTVISLDELGLQEKLKPHTKILKYESPPARKAGVKLKDVNELLDKLTNEVKVL